MDGIISGNMDPKQMVQPESDEIQNKLKQEQEQEEQMSRNVLLAALLEPEARGRLSRIALVSPERSKMIEEMLLGRAGKLRSRVTELQLIGLLDEIEGVKGNAESKKNKIVYDRRKGGDDFDI